MKKIILTYGLIAGAVMGITLSLSIALIGHNMDASKGMVIGYTTMVLALTLVFFGTRSYREQIGNGVISFGRAFGVGILITLVASVIYVIAWMLIQYFMIPDFYEKYISQQIEVTKASGKSAAEIASDLKDIEDMKVTFQSPVMVFLFTFLEPLPVGILMTLISSLIVKRKTAVVAN